jgi:flagellar protein FlaI
MDSYMGDITLNLDRVLSSLLGADTSNKKASCPVRFRSGQNGTEATLDCSACRGRSSIDDPECMRRIMGALSGRSELDKLLLEKYYVREYNGEHLAAIMGLAGSCDDILMQASTLATYGCGKCDRQRKARVTDAVESIMADPSRASDYVSEALGDVPAGRNAPGCVQCKGSYDLFLRDLMQLSGRVRAVRYDMLMPYVMPKFSTTRILVEPPRGSVFLRSYDVKKDDGFSPDLHVSLYELPESVEKLYFIVPWEYVMDEEDVLLVVDAKKRLLRQRPENDDFLDASATRAFFRRHARESIMDAARKLSIRIDIDRLERLSAAFVKYTCGLGILEDILTDPCIQDAYVNTPVGYNPLHLLVDGEEVTSNVFLSESDVESMISRLRSISGRPFSEANPVLDMDLGEFHTRVSVIGNPLSRGLAYAFRRHKKTPWTLPQLVSTKMLSPYAAGLLSFLVDGQASMLVTGTRGAGKTSLLGAMMLEILQGYRILVIEDTPELPVEDMQEFGWKIQGICTRSAVSGSEAEFQATDALRAALRLGESALILGEVRGSEARSLYEAMRVGASGNSVMGTIHGASCRDVFERVVHDIGVPPPSFKATDAVIVCSTVRPGGSVLRNRRVIQIAEVVKGEWDDDVDSVFNDLLLYDVGPDELCITERIDTGRSEVISGIARKWGITLEEANREILARAGVMRSIVDYGALQPSVMEAGSYSRCVNMYRVLCDRNRREHGSPDFGEIEASWESWFGGLLKECA